MLGSSGLIPTMAGLILILLAESGVSALAWLISIFAIVPGSLTSGDLYVKNGAGQLHHLPARCKLTSSFFLPLPNLPKCMMYCSILTANAPLRPGPAMRKDVIRFIGSLLVRFSGDSSRI